MAKNVWERIILNIFELMGCEVRNRRGLQVWKIASLIHKQQNVLEIPKYLTVSSRKRAIING